MVELKGAQVNISKSNTILRRDAETWKCCELKEWFKAN